MSYLGGLEGLGQTLSKVGKATTEVLKDNIKAPSMLQEFNKEQEDFIKSNSKSIHAPDVLGN